MGWELLLANVLCLPIILAAWVRLGPGQALAYVGALLYLDWRIVRGWTVKE